MSNENVGLRCPKCGETKNIQIRLDRWWASISEEGNYSMSCMGFPYETDICRCAMSEGTCGHTATVADFRQKPVAQMLLEACECYVSSQTDDNLNTAVLVNQVEIIALELAEKALEAYKQRGPNG